MPHQPPTGLAATLAEVRGLFRLALPIVVGLSAATMIGVVDTVMISPLGTVPLAAAAITTSVAIIFYSGLYGLVSVIGIQIAQAFGAGDPADISRKIRNGAVLCLGMGLLAAVLMTSLFWVLRWLDQPPEVLEILFPYWTAMSFVMVPFAVFYVFKALFDAVDRPWIGVGFAFFGVLVNIPLNYLLIYGVGAIQGLGLVGAGIASLMSEALSLLAGWFYWRHAPAMAPYRQHTRLLAVEMRVQLREGLPLCLGYIGEGGAFALVGLMLGWLGAAALAANQIVTAVTSVIYMLPLGVAAAVAIKVGQAIGGTQTERLRPIALAAFGVVTVWMLVVTAGLIFGGRAMAAALTDDPRVVALATVMFITVALIQVADGIQSTALGALRGMMDNRTPTLITLAAYWPIALPAAYVAGFVLGFGAVGIWVGYGFGILLAAIVLPWRFWRKTAEL